MGDRRDALGYFHAGQNQDPSVLEAVDIVTMSDA
jgi:hypothetical protein